MTVLVFDPSGQSQVIEVPAPPPPELRVPVQASLTEQITALLGRRPGDPPREPPLRVLTCYHAGAGVYFPSRLEGIACS